MVIYKITNLINAKIYIGQTIQSPNERWRRHCKGTDKTAISAAIKKYGKNNFYFEIIEECNSIEQLNEREQEIISDLKALSPNGYNLESGGKNKKMHESSKMKIGLANSGENNGWFGKKTVHSRETIEKISHSKKNVPNPKVADVLRGRTKKEFAYLENISKNKKEQYKGSNNPNSKEIEVFGIKYLTMKEASESTGMSLYRLRKLANESYDSKEN